MFPTKYCTSSNIQTLLERSIQVAQIYKSHYLFSLIKISRQKGNQHEICEILSYALNKSLHVSNSAWSVHTGGWPCPCAYHIFLWVSVKAGLWTMDWTVDWTMD